MNMRRGIFLLCAALLVLAGCDNGSTVTDATSSAGKASTTNKVGKVKVGKPRPLPVIDTLASTAVVVRVNGTSITRGQFAAQEDLKTRMWAIANGKTLTPPNKEVRDYRAQNRMNVLGELIKDELIRQYAKKHGIVTDPVRLSAREKDFLKAMKREKDGLDGVITLLGGKAGPRFRELVSFSALIDTVLQKETTNDIFTVTEEQITNRVEFVKKFNASAAARNATNFVRAAQARAEILAEIGSRGLAVDMKLSAVTNTSPVVATKRDTRTADAAVLFETNSVFAKVALKYADTNAWEGASWTTVELDDFDADDALAQWLYRADIGDVSEPMELDDGIAIVGLKRKIPMEIMDEGARKITFEYELVRCFFYYYESEPEYSKHADLVSAIRDERWAVAMGELRDKLTANAVIEFPEGQNLFYPRAKPKKQVSVKRKNLKKAINRKAPGQKPQKKVPDISQKENSK